MLSLKPGCENCDKPLPPESTQARVCSYECTFCADCVDELQNVCPNCGGGFERRPVRPAKEWVGGVSVKAQPPVQDKTWKPVDMQQHSLFAAEIAPISAHKR